MRTLYLALTAIVAFSLMLGCGPKKQDPNDKPVTSTEVPPPPPPT